MNLLRIQTVGWRRGLLVAVLLAIGSCGVIPDIGLTPISADATFGGEHEVAIDEDNMVKVQTGDSSTTKYESETVEQIYNDVQEYPLWLVLAFAIAVGIALPSPVAAWGNYRRRRLLEKQIEVLTKALSKSTPHYQSDMEKT